MEVMEEDTSVAEGGVMGVKVWVLGTNASGEPEILGLQIGATSDEVDDGIHYERAMSVAQDQGYCEPMIAFDESDPAGRTLRDMAEMQSMVSQVTVPGSESAREWVVPLAVDMSMSAQIRVRARSKDEAIELAQEFAAGEGKVLFSLDGEVYRSKADYYVSDEDEVRLAQDGDRL